MKSPRLGMLMCCAVVFLTALAKAETGGSVITTMDSRSLGGYVSTEASWQSSSPGVHGIRRWFEATFHRLRMYLWK